MTAKLLRSRWSGPLALAITAYFPLLLTRRGLVVADTKQYLTLDPGGVLAGSASLWDPDWALGTVTHQSIGYLWPMGPWFWVFDTIGFPDWVAQRLWIGTILFLAGLGCTFLGRTFGWTRSASLVAAFVYLLSPYPLAYATRISVLVLPWAALPWLVALGVRSLRREGWREPLAIALIGTTVGSVNASSLLYAGLAVVIWFPFAVFVFREVSIRAAVTTALRIGVALVAACLWWVVALLVQGQHGADVLQFSETLDVVASGSPASEAWRGLGYWILYGGDRTDEWVTAGVAYTQQLWVIAASFAVAGVSALALLVARWRYRAYFLALAVVGLVLTIGFHPYDDPGGVLGLVRDDVADTGFALALRSSPRALPLFLLATAGSIAVAVDAMPTRLLRRRAGVAVVGLAALGLPALWTGGYIGDELARDERVQADWRAAAEYLDAGDANSRAIILPGADFSAHRWGNTIDHVLPGLTDRPVAVRELVAFGPAASADLLIALDRRAQEGLFEPEAVAPIARLLGAGDVIVQSDLEYERYRLPRPDAFWAAIEGAPGFQEAVEFGAPTPNRASDEFPLLDELELTMAPDLPAPPPVAALSISDPLGVIRVRPAAGPLIVAGDGESLVDLAVAGLLPADRLVLYEATLDDDQLAAAVAAGAEVALTDGNRLEARRWKTIRDNRGMTEQAGGDELRPDQTDARLNVFPDAPVGSFTTARLTGVIATASAYGNPISYHSEDRAAHAVDGDTTTAWRTGAFSDARGEALTLVFPVPVEARSATVVQPSTLDPNRFISELDVAVNGGPFERRVLDSSSLTSTGQVLDLGVAEIRSLVLRIWETSAGRRPGYGGLSSVGFAEVRVGETVLSETMVMAPRLSERLDALDADLPTTVLMSRERARGVRDDPERLLRREFNLAAANEFAISGSARLNGYAPDAVLDDVLGLEAAPRAVASERLVGGVEQRASAVLDGDPSTAWMPPFGEQRGHWIELDLGEPTIIERIELDLRADGRHSVPTVLEVETDAGIQEVALDDVVDVVGIDDALAHVVLPIDPVTTESLRLTIRDVRAIETIEWFSASRVVLPIGIAEVRVGGHGANLGGLEQLSSCREDLIEIDGRPVSVRLVPTDSESGAAPMAIEACGPTLALAPGPHLVETAAGRHGGIDVDLLVLRSTDARRDAAAVPAIDIREHGRGVAEVAFSDATEPFWLVLGESYENGWSARIVDGPDLGGPTLVDGFANGWLVDPALVGTGATIELEWRPNGTVRFGFVVSVLGILAIIGLALRRHDSLTEAPGPVPALGPHPTTVPTWSGRITLAATAAILSATVMYLWIAVLVGVLTLIGCSRGIRRWTLILAVGSAVGLMAGYVFIQQARFGAPHDGAWPSLWQRAHILGWVALGGVIGEFVIEVVRSRGRSAQRVVR